LIGASKPNLSESEKSEVSKDGYKHVRDNRWGNLGLQEHDRFQSRKECKEAEKK
jgi:hypothetical protein